MKAIILKVIMMLLVALTYIAGAAGMKREKYVPYEATPDEVAVTKVGKKVVYDRIFEQPQNEVFRKHLRKVLEIAENEESRIRYMLEKGMVRTTYWNGLSMGSVIVRPEKTVYHYTLLGASKKIGPVEKTAYEDQADGKIKKQSECYSFVFYDDADSVMSFGYGQDPRTITLNFYPSNKLESCGLIIDGQYYRARWDKDGKLLEQKITPPAGTTGKTNELGTAGNAEEESVVPAKP